MKVKGVLQEVNPKEYKVEETQPVKSQNKEESKDDKN